MIDPKKNAKQVINKIWDEFTTNAKMLTTRSKSQENDQQA